MAGIALPDIVTDRCRSLLGHWFSLPRPPHSLIPLKSALDPLAIPKLLPRVLLHDLRQPGRAILRLVGTGLVEQYGFDPTGHDYERYVEPERWPSALAELVKVAGHPCGMRVLTEHVHSDGRVHENEAVGLPLEADDGSGRFLLFVDEIVKAPVGIDPRRRPVRHLVVKQRDYLDIGGGAPSAGATAAVR
ncbi:MAG: PAS domain-containing protein [Thalassobaculum sp.]|uniref:PAS domain-containing protein n=1 Tax=Thalassobaculum sp. TaxID=2022740 RepID=UPI0032EC96F8